MDVVSLYMLPMQWTLLLLDCMGPSLIIEGNRNVFMQAFVLLNLVHLVMFYSIVLAGVKNRIAWNELHLKWLWIR